jgi:hypothetical protein
MRWEKCAECVQLFGLKMLRELGLNKRIILKYIFTRHYRPMCTKISRFSDSCNWLVEQGYTNSPKKLGAPSKF